MPQVAAVSTSPTPIDLGTPSRRAEVASQRGATLYNQGMFCCEAVLTVVNEAAGNPFSADVMRLGSGFWGGLAGDGSTCGALVGAVMAVGLLGGRTHTDGAWEPSTKAAEEIRRRFGEEFGSVTCGALVRPFGGMDGEGRRTHCALLTGRAAAIVVELAEERGWL